MPAKKKIKNLLVVFLGLALLGGLAGCGKKGYPDAPSGSVYNFPGVYPHPDDSE